MTTLGLLLAAATLIAVFVILFLVLKMRTLVGLVSVITTVVAGVVVYYFGVDAAMWVPYAAAIALYARYIAQRTISTRTDHDHLRWPAPAMLMALFVTFMLVTSVANGIPAAQFLVALKNYGAMWLVAIVVASLPNVVNTISSFEKGAVALSLLQLPFVLQQAFSTRNWDAAVGTFGGDPNGGGATGILMVFSIVGILSSISLWQSGRIGLLANAVVISVNVVVVALAEVKGFFLLFPLALLIQQWPTVRRRPIQFIGLMSGAVLIVYFLVGAYEQLYIARSPGWRQLSATASIQRSFGYFFDGTSLNFVTGEVSRGASIMLWLNDVQTDLLRRLVGYGAGASRPKSTVAIGEIAMRFAPLNISATSIAQLLWDTGIVGATMFALALLTAFQLAVRMAKRATDILVKSQLKTMSAVFGLLIPFLIYDRSLVDQPAMQLLAALLFGWLVALRRQEAAISSPAVAISAPRTSAPNAA